MTAITLDRLAKAFGRQSAVRDIDLDIPDGAFVVLLGPSGCGKTTTLRMLAGLEEPTAGRIRFGDRVVADGDTGASVPASKRGLGMVFQSYALWPHMRVRDNIGWPLKVAGWGSAERDARVAEVLGMLELDGLADRFPAELSGGQQQRVAIARTVAPKPGVLLFDEPLSNLDARLRLDTRAELVKVHRLSGATSVYVTHDQVEALAMATHIAVMRDGAIEQFGTPQELLDRPATAFVASFLGSPAKVMLRGEVGRGRLFRGVAPLAEVPDVPDGTTLHAMYAPESISVGAGGLLEFEVLESTPVAGRWITTGLAGSDRLSIVTDRAHQPGEATRLQPPEHPDAIFSADGSRLAAAGDAAGTELAGAAR
ncbi:MULTISPECIES: ABC transporter ATP-binding protein [unclassified Pseudoclavibacter]|uniref:ABC transporter ATP-binding protein n=1 Tax=unclassified Pseudoclavibacter TaxID=2615177 RepID=UPI000CE7E9F0|nr:MULTISPECIES: ABC transporter ATP-binding protein [unclassified Pseudoclavibacter]MBF4550986.1 ABC transporter ATP-binding protein [Pseudoclavibacter sp. VKM Ac-2888]PPF73360.1 ABC transporter ATP-binding protein [Pseudoclavibacter sp. Z016]